MTETTATKTRSLKSELRKTFDGSDDLFNACWRRVGRSIAEGYFDDPADALDQTANELVNDPDSRFFIFG